MKYVSQTPVVDIVAWKNVVYHTDTIVLCGVFKSVCWYTSFFEEQD